jgi:hypothetical protein
MIAAARKITARAASFIFWPLTMLGKPITRTNRKLIRWAIRKQVGAVYVAALFWAPALSVAGLTWAVLSVHQKPVDAWGPAVGLALLIAKKVMALFSYLLDQHFRAIKALRHYRRHFGKADSYRPQRANGHTGTN